MLASDSRFLTTHAGSLPRPADLADLHDRRSGGEDVDLDRLRAAVAAAATDVMAAQVEAGIDVGNDGGFDASAGIGDVAPAVVWAKLCALRAGADLASARVSHDGGWQ